MDGLIAMVFSKQFWCVNVSFWFPCVIGIRVSFPMNTILLFPFSAKQTHPDDCFYFPFGLSFNDVGGGSK